MVLCPPVTIILPGEWEQLLESPCTHPKCHTFQTGTEKERAVYNLAVKRVNIHGENSNGTHDGKPGVSMKIVELTKPVSGKDIDLKLILNSNDNETRTLVINVNVQAMRYTGIPSSQIQTELKKLKLLPNQGRVKIFQTFSVSRPTRFNYHSSAHREAFTSQNKGNWNT